MSQVILTDGEALYEVHDETARAIVDFQNGINPSWSPNMKFYEFNGKYIGVRYPNGDAAYRRLIAFLPQQVTDIKWRIREDLELGEPIETNYL